MMPDSEFHITLHHQHDDVLQQMKLLAFHGMYETSYGSSVFKNWYNNACEHNTIRPGLQLAIVHHNNEPVCVANVDPCWDQTERSIQMYMLKNSSSLKSKINLHIDKSFQWMGRVSVYTKPEYRQQGIARMAAKELLRAFEDHHPIAKNHVPMYWGEERALRTFGLTDDNIHRYRLPHNIYAGNSKLRLHQEAYRFLTSVLEKKQNRPDLIAYKLTRTTPANDTWKPYIEHRNQVLLELDNDRCAPA